MKTALNIRDVDEQLVRRFRAECFSRNIKQAELLRILMDKALERPPVALEGFPVSAGTALGA